MPDLIARQPSRPLFWPNIVETIAEIVADVDKPIYIVGGAVRDALLHLPLQDLDLATSTGAVDLARRIANRLHGDVFVLDAERDVGRALVNVPEGRMIIDVASFRGADLLNDLYDRDFTLNAMAVDLHGDINLIIDPLNGHQDMLDRTIRRCSVGVIERDPIRALRAVRQSVQYNFRIESETLHEVRIAAPLLAEISPERIRDEFIKLLALSRPAVALRVADAVDLLSTIVPEVALLHQFQQEHIVDSWQHTLVTIDYMSNILLAISPKRSDSTAASFGLGVMVMQLDRFRSQLHQHIEAQWPNERPHRSLLMLGALLHACGKPIMSGPSQTGQTPVENQEQTVVLIAIERANALRLSNVERDRLVAMIRYYTILDKDEVITPLMMHHFWRQAGSAGVDACLLGLANYLAKKGTAINQDAWLIMVERARLLLEAYFQHFNEIVEPPLLVDGARLMSVLNLKPGPVVGKLLDCIREAQVTGDVQTLDDALHVARLYLTENYK